MKKKYIILITLLILSIIIEQLFLKPKKTDENFTDKLTEDKEMYEYKEEKNILTKDSIEIRDIDGKKTNYSFIYNDETYTAIYTSDNWKIVDSYKITNTDDIKIICNKLIEIHKIHGKDMTSYRTPEDMTYEWLQHNIVYQLLPNNHKFKDNAKDVDLDPKDQGKNMIEIYEDRTGEKFDLSNLSM